MKPWNLAPGPGMVLNPFRSPAALRRIQERKLRRLIRHAYANVPFYRETMDGLGLTPDDIRTLDDLPRLPIVSKTQIQALPMEAKTAGNIDLGRCKAFMTSGTSGLPLQFFITRADFAVRNLNCARTYLAAGMKLWDRTALLAGDLVVNRRRTLRHRLGIWRRLEISSWLEPDVWIEEMLRWQPTALIGRVTTLAILAEAMKARGVEGIRPRIVISSAEMLDEASRRLFVETFGARVVDHYGCFETGCAAWECRACGAYHINTDVLVFEILGPDGRPATPGSSGEVVVTNLHTYAMPFIRYRQEDMVVPSAKPSRCGRTFPLIDRIDGRKEDRLILQSGRYISPQSIPHVFIPVPGIKRWQVVQTDPGRVKIHIEPGPKFDAAARRLLREEMMKLLREDISLEIVETDSIPWDRTAKFRPIICRVKR